MKIVGGKFKGKKLLLPTDKNTRPLRNMVKESIFNLLENSNKFELKIKNSNILDLFSGSGSFGLECISRDANSVIFVENYSKAYEVLKKNVSQFKFPKKCEIFKKNCFDFLKIKNFKEKFNIIFIDPPFREKNINLLLEQISEKKILNKKGIIIIHKHKKDNFKIFDRFSVIDERIYGISKIIIGY